MMQAQEWKDHVYNCGYNDAMGGRLYTESFNEQMKIGAMREYYDRGFNDGRQDK